jgi:hypothetical protein
VDYRQSGVDIDAGNDTVRRIKALARSTYTPGVLSGVGSFGGLFALGRGGGDTVLVASADGVGTKLKVAFLAGVRLSGDGTSRAGGGRADRLRHRACVSREPVRAARR